MHPFKLKPACKDYLWGGTKLKNEYGKECGTDILAETWELSAHPAGSSVVASGEHQGMLFADLIKKHPEICGSCCSGGEFPILIKFIDAKQSLSVQVHPDDAYAFKNEGEPGKNEMWVVMENQPGAYLYFGFEQEISKEEMRRRINDNTLTEVLHKAPVKPGDVFYIKAGTIHAIGAGILLAEVQQNSNSTYRVFDFGRTDAQGNQRELHVEKALDVTITGPGDFTPPGACVLDEGEGYLLERLVQCPNFSAARLRLDGEFGWDATGESFYSLLCLDGEASVEYQGGNLGIAKGESAFVPAESGECCIKGKAEIIITYME